jgi:MYXO-CTERM domain-containing protein
MRPGGAFDETTELPAFTLTDVTGQSVPAGAERLGGRDSRDFAVLPLAALAPGEYLLKFDRAEMCQEATTNPLESRFTVGPAAPLPQVAGSLRVGERSIIERLMVNANISGCRTPIRAAVHPLLFESSPELVPFLPVTKFTVTLQASNASERLFWVQTHHGTYSHDVVAVNLRHSNQLFSACEYSSMWWDSGLRPGHYRGELVAEVAGMAPLPALFFEVNVTECPPVDPIPPGQPSTIEPERDGCGCQIGGNMGDGGSALLGVLALLLALNARPRK